MAICFPFGDQATWEMRSLLILSTFAKGVGDGSAVLVAVGLGGTVEVGSDVDVESGVEVGRRVEVGAAVTAVVGDGAAEEVAAGEGVMVAMLVVPPHPERRNHEMTIRGVKALISLLIVYLREDSVFRIASALIRLSDVRM